MFAASVGIFGQEWFWVVMIIIVGLGYLAKETAKAASNPWVQSGAKGIWSLFK